MKSTIRHGILLLFILNFGCSDEIPITSKSFIKVMDVTESYNSRTVLVFDDQSFLQTGVAAIHKFNSDNNPSSDLPSLIAKYDQFGNLLWQKELPENIQTLWHCSRLKNGNIVAVGFNSDANSEFVGLTTITPDGSILEQHTFFNSSRSLPSGYGDNSIDCKILTNGNIALVVPHSRGSNINLIPRLVIFDVQLNKIIDKYYPPNNIVFDRDIRQISVEEEEDGSLLLSGIDNGKESDTINYYGFMMRLSASSYEPVAYKLFHNEKQQSFAKLVIDKSYNIVVPTSGHRTIDSVSNNWFNYRNQEKFVVGPAITLTKFNSDFKPVKQTTIEGYPKNGFIERIKNCSDGGFILIGTCNIKSNLLVPSDYKLLIVKVSDNLSIEWIQTPNTNGPTIAADITETNDGYLISATHFSLGEFNRPIVLKTDFNGIIQ